MDRSSINNPGKILFIFTLISGFLSIIIVVNLMDRYSLKDPFIAFPIFFLMFIPIYWYLFPSFKKEEEKVSLANAKKYYNEGKLGKALAELNEIIEVNPNNTSALSLKEKINKTYNK